MKGISARRIKVKLGEAGESPNLHILFTMEDDDCNLTLCRSKFMIVTRA
jgi:hypothetical protein